MKTKIITIFSIVSFFILLVTGCSSSKTSFTPGIYTGYGEGKEGDIQVEVTFSEKEIQKIDIISANETEGLGDVAMDQMTDNIIEEQSLAIDSVSGATYSSNAIIQAVEDCVIQAGGDTEALK
ncbi:MAG: FMN-binding protein [Eubacteriaceae bacterium]